MMAPGVRFRGARFQRWVFSLCLTWPPALGFFGGTGPEGEDDFLGRFGAAGGDGVEEADGGEAEVVVGDDVDGDFGVGGDVAVVGGVVDDEAGGFVVNGA